MGHEVSSKNMPKFIKTHWKNMVTPILVNQVGIFLFSFHSHADMIHIYEGLTDFVFDKLLLLNHYKPGMILSKALFDLAPV